MFLSFILTNSCDCSPAQTAATGNDDRKLMLVHNLSIFVSDMHGYCFMRFVANRAEFSLVELDITS